jgi:hypothetical protein
MRYPLYLLYVASNALLVDGEAAERELRKTIECEQYCL